MASAEEGSPQLHPGRPPLSLGTRGEQASFILPPPCSFHLPRPSLAGLVVVERGEVLGQNEDFIYLFISISFALCLVPEFAGRSKKEEREEVIMSLHKQPFRARETGWWLGTSFWGWGGASRRHRICIEVSAGHQRGVRTQTQVQLPQNSLSPILNWGWGFWQSTLKVHSPSFLDSHFLWAPQLDRSTICLLSVQKLVLFLFFGHTTWFVGS